MAYTKGMQCFQGRLANGAAAAALKFQASRSDRGPRRGATEAVSGPAIDGFDDRLGLGATTIVSQLRPVADRPGGEQIRGPSLRLPGGTRPAGQLKLHPVAGAGADLGVD
jgi:hypothetical protein